MWVVHTMTGTPNLQVQAELMIKWDARLRARPNSENNDSCNEETTARIEGKQRTFGKTSDIAVCYIVHSSLLDEVLEVVALDNVVAEVVKQLTGRGKVVDSIAIVNSKVPANLSISFLVPVASGCGTPYL